MMKSDFSSGIIIIGGGAAGLAAAQYGARSALKTTVLDGTGSEGGAGGQAAEINYLENYPGIFPRVSGTDFIKAMMLQAEHFGADILHTAAASLDKVGGTFTVHCTDGTVRRAQCVILATGASKKHLGVEGEEAFLGRGVSYCATCDGPFFRGKKIVVVGGGDSALSEALYLSTLSPHVTIVHRRGEFRGNAMLVDRVKKARIALKLGQVVTQIVGDDRVRGVKIMGTNEAATLDCDAVFICVGTAPRTELVDFLQKSPSGYIKTDCNMQTSCPGLFAAGDVRDTPLRQVVTAAADGAVAAASAAEYINS